MLTAKLSSVKTYWMNSSTSSKEESFRNSYAKVPQLREVLNPAEVDVNESSGLGYAGRGEGVERGQEFVASSCLERIE